MTTQIPVPVIVQGIVNSLYPHTADLTIVRETTWENLKLDSLDLVQLAIQIEAHFGIDVDERDMPATYGGLVDMVIEQRRAARKTMEPEMAKTKPKTKPMPVMRLLKHEKRMIRAVKENPEAITQADTDVMHTLRDFGLVEKLPEATPMYRLSKAGEEAYAEIVAPEDE